MEKKKNQLGMNASTAAHRLRVDLLFQFAVKAGHKCHHCGLDLNREAFSIEHKSAWLDSENPKKSFFDLENIAYSHLGCNSRNKRHPNQKYFSEDERKAGNAEKQKKYKATLKYNSAVRAEKYARKGT